MLATPDIQHNSGKQADERDTREEQLGAKPSGKEQDQAARDHEQPDETGAPNRCAESERRSHAKNSASGNTKKPWE